MIENDSFRGTSSFSPAVIRAAFTTSILSSLGLHDVEVHSILFKEGFLRSSRTSSQQTSQRRFLPPYLPETV